MAVTLEPFQERALSQLRSGNVLVGEVGSGKSKSGTTIMPLKGSPDLA